MEKYFNLDKAKEILDSGLNQAQELLKDTSKIDSLLQELEPIIQALGSLFGQ